MPFELVIRQDIFQMDQILTWYITIGIIVDAVWFEKEPDKKLHKLIGAAKYDGLVLHSIKCDIKTK